MGIRSTENRQKIGKSVHFVLNEVLSRKNMWNNFILSDSLGVISVRIVPLITNNHITDSGNSSSLQFVEDLIKQRSVMW